MTKMAEKPPEINIIRAWCKGCLLCIEVCPKNVYERSESGSGKGTREIAAARPNNCTRCMRCVMFCPDMAIEVE